MVAGADALRSEIVGELVGSRFHLGVGAPLAVVDHIRPVGPFVGGLFEQVGQVERALLR